MKIIEAIKEFPLILKRMDANSVKIAEYSSILSIQDDLPFGTAEAQKKEVAALVQSNLDLTKRYLTLVRQLAVTNTQTMVEIGGDTCSITEWLAIQGLPKGPQISARVRNTYLALNITSAQAKLPHAGVDLTQKPVSITRLYDQKSTDETIRKWDDTLGMINAKLEVVNATTDLVQ